MSGSTAKGTAVRIGKLVIIGVGLIGGSFALSLRRAGQVGQVVGVGRSRENLERALELGVIDSWTQDAAAAVQKSVDELKSSEDVELAAEAREIASKISSIDSPAYSSRIKSTTTLLHSECFFLLSFTTGVKSPVSHCLARTRAD